MYGMNLTEISSLWEAGYDRLRCSYKFDLISLVIPGSSVGIGTDYGLEGPGSNPGGDEIFRPSRPTLRPTQPL